MRLWHQSLLPYLDNKRLMSQHRECCALRGKGWGKKHATVDYVFKYDLAHLYQYHMLVMREITQRYARRIDFDYQWYNRLYRGKSLPMTTLVETGSFVHNDGEMIYNEHNDKYLKECLLNLKSKGAELVNGETIDHMLIKLDLT